MTKPPTTILAHDTPRLGEFDRAAVDLAAMLYGDGREAPRDFGLSSLLTDEQLAAVKAAAEPADVVISDPMYGSLAGVLQAAHDHAARGKGHDRHGSDDVPFLEQPTMQISRMVGLGYPAGQIMKKADEAKRMADRGEYDAAVFEFFGVINYAAAAILALREM
ncbi:hypothetical protein IVB18_26120 [Bradyrhizobium sp. 186]|uniref:hypothetical protein n=1 Tax=Bradyrhizobium sp. 186 TaxID=2782654 RepID=UPI002000C0C5|nr:hypothetical protein [Bradyrhizobium sp. 186]UPK31809.1 hypothetical protein IVB18_26120 [Bradyrhizobium sp. 186]